MARYEITAGPSKFDLSVVLFHTPSEGGHHTVNFTLKKGRSKAISIVQVVITSVGVEDGSRERWVITGWVKNGQNTKFHGCFETHQRTGYLMMD